MVEAVRTCPVPPAGNAFQVVEATKRFPVVVAAPAMSERIFGNLNVQVGEDEEMIRSVTPYWVEVASVTPSCLADQ